MTYLYIKQHTITGKLYFGKTKSNPETYLGSGKHWKRHINLHGKCHVVTLWHQLYDNVFDLVADALSLSNGLDIVHSSSWLNLKPENGLDGGDTSVHINYANRVDQSGENNPMYGRTHSIETRQKISSSNKGKVISEEHKRKVSEKLSGENAPLWGIMGEAHPAYGRRGESSPMYGVTGEKHHFYGKNHTPDTILKMSKKNNILCPDGTILYQITYAEFCIKFGLNYNSARHIFPRRGKYMGYILIHDVEAA